MKRLSKAILMSSLAFLVSYPVLAADNTRTVKKPGKNIRVQGYDKRCNADIPPYKPKDPNYNPNQTQVSINADEVTATMNDVEYSGNVDIVQGDKHLKADKTKFNQETQEMNAEGDIFYQDGDITVETDEKIKTNFDTNRTEMDKPEYHINGSLVRGKASKAYLDSDNKTIKLENAYITTCPKNEESWSIYASSVDVDQNEIFGEAWNTVFWIRSVPVFYTPYINFPIKNVRKTGFLYPTLEYSHTDGYDISIPLYLNIAPNYDMTITPEIISHRGLMMKGEFRYLPFANTFGKLYGEIITRDNHPPIFEGEEIEKRWMFNFNQKTYWDGGDYGLLFEYTKVADNDFNYFNDYSHGVVDLIDNQLKQEAKFFVDKNQFDAYIKVLRYQLMIPENALYSQPFELMPQVVANYRDNVADLFAYNMQFEFSKFAVQNSTVANMYQSERYHFQPEIEIPILNDYGFNINAQGRLFYTYYKQDIPDNMSRKYASKGFSSTNMDTYASRFLYEGEINAKVTFVNNLQSGYMLTIEPEVQYIYIPYKNQDHIGIYDSVDRQNDYYSLFNYKVYSGNDRISDLNRIGMGITHRIYDQKYRERLRFNIGQGYDFVPRRVKLYPNDTTNYYPRTPVFSALNVNILEGLSAHGDIVYSTEDNETSNWNAQLNGAFGDYSGQISYRYSRDGNRTLKGNEIIDVKQLGGSLMFPITNDIKVVGAMYYDLEQNQNIDRKLAMKYESCCYTVGFQIERYNKPDNATLTAEEETRYGIFFELKGLAGAGLNTDFGPGTYLMPYNDMVNLSK